MDRERRRETEETSARQRDSAKKKASTLQPENALPTQTHLTLIPQQASGPQGTDTTSSTVEWTMAELLKKPKILAKAQVDLKEVIGNDGIVHETDTSKLPYLQAVVKEILRLHPSAPFLLPRKAEANVEMGGFMVPKNAQVLVNVWAIGRDSSIWIHPDSFVPERFLDLKVDMRGQDFELIPFGAGRRICPGLPLTYQMVHFMLASLLHSFGSLEEERNQKI